MTAALFAALFFTLSAVFSQRAARLFGALEVNCLRLIIATAVLGLITWIMDGVSGTTSLHPTVYGALFVSGLVGFGLGDVGLFLAYPRLGSRRTILINFCTATLVGAVMDWCLLRETISWMQGACVVSILIGLIVALAPSSAAGSPSGLPFAGICFAVVAGIGQGFGTTLSGWANQVAADEGMKVHGISQAFQRTSAGVLFAAAALGIVRFAAGRRAAKVAAGLRPAPPPDSGRLVKTKSAGCWMAGTALWGPVIGVSFYQMARQTESSAVVLAVAATSTLLVIPLARVLEKDHPGPRQVIGSMLAAAGVIGLCLAKA